MVLGSGIHEFGFYLYMVVDVALSVCAGCVMLMLWKLDGWVAG
jgi:hypothetical protein